VVAYHGPDQPEDRHGSHQHHRRSERWRLGREGPELSYRRRHDADGQNATRKPVIFGKFTGYAGDARRCGGLERPVSRARRPRREFVLGGWATHYRPTEQSLLQPDSIGLDSVARSCLRGPPAEYGGKTSLVIKVTTQSGLGVTKPRGTVYSRMAVSVQSVVASGWPSAAKNGGILLLRTDEQQPFLDPPELHAIHDKGNEENLFDRVDYNVTSVDSIHTNFQYTRSCSRHKYDR